MRILPSVPLSRGRRHLKTLALIGLALAAAGCAKFPGAGAAGNNTKVKFTMTVAGVIKPNYIYAVAIRWAKVNPPFDQDRGPVPVFASPWGNGIVAGRANVYMLWDAFQSPTYQMRRFTDPIPDDQVPGSGAYLTNTVIEQPPLNYVEIPEGGKTIDFELDMSQIAPAGEVADIRALQINFLTMDRVLTGSDSGTKFWDALGNGNSPLELTKYLTIPVTVNQTYSNNSNPENVTELSGDVPDPDLDIVNWTVQVILP